MSTSTTSTLSSVNPADPNDTNIPVTFAQVVNPNENIIQMSLNYLIPTIGPSNDVTYTEQAVVLTFSAEDLQELGRNIDLILA